MGMFNTRGAITMRDSKVTGNSAGVDGGGVFLLGGPPSVLQFTDVKIRNNTPNDCVGAEAWDNWKASLRDASKRA